MDSCCVEKKRTHAAQNILYGDFEIFPASGRTLIDVRSEQHMVRLHSRVHASVDGASGTRFVVNQRGSAMYF